MRRDPDALTTRRWDLLVIGGGIHGLFAAWDAAQRGLSVALVDAADFGGGVSFNHQRTLHGGLRALQQGALRKARRQIEERRAWARIAPHMVRPLPFLIGTYREIKRSRLALRAGFRMYDWIGRSRNAGVAMELHLPKTRLESAATTRKLFPGIAPKGLTGGAIWYDYQTRHPDRLTWLVACAARRAGATLVNYVRATGPRRAADGRVTGATLRDELDGRELEVAACVTLLTPGAGLGDLLQAFGAGEGPPLLRAMNLLLARPARDIALAAPGRSGRMLTAVPWAGSLLVGTAQSETIVAAGQGAPSTAEVHAFLADANSAFPALQAQADAVRLVHWGLTPAVVRHGRDELRPEAEITKHATQRLIAMAGVKYTTARAAAEQAIDAAVAIAAKPTRRCRTADTPLPHATIADVEGRLAETQRALGVELAADISTHLASWYGTEAPDVLNHAAAHGEIDRLDPASPVLAGEISYAVEHADAIRLSDAVLRRTVLGSAGRPGRAALDRAAAIMARLCGWSPEQIEREIEFVERRYVIGT